MHTHRNERITRDKIVLRVKMQNNLENWLL